jgi:uncharacterized protein
MKTRALDSWPILEWIRGRQPAADIVARLLDDAEHDRARLFMSAINVGETYYFLMKHHSDALAQSWRESSRTLPITIETPNIDDIWSAATLKGKYPISFADAFAFAIAQKYNCHLLTGDPDFRCIGDLSVEWLVRS